MTTLRSTPNEHPAETPEPKVKGLLIVALLLVVAGLLALAWWYVQLPVAQSLTNDTIFEPLVGAERAVLELDVGAGRLQLAAGSGEQMLEGRVQTLAGVETFTRTATAENGALVYRLLSDAPDAIREPARWPEWTLKVNPEVPLELRVRGGMGPSDLDLSGLTMTDFVLNTGAGRYTVLFPEQGRLEAVVEGGSSQTTLLLPSGVALKAVMQVRGAGHIDLDGQVYRRNASYTSPDYATAANRLDLVVTSHLANIVIEQR